VGQDGVIDRSRLYRFTFPVQETKLKAGDAVEDPRTHEDGSGNWVTHRVGSIHDIDPARGMLVIKRGTMREPMPTALIPGGPPGTAVLRDALLRVGAVVRDHGIDAWLTRPGGDFVVQLDAFGHGVQDPGETSANCPGDVRLFPKEDDQ